MNRETSRRNPNREALWRERIAALEASGKTDSQWCRENNICRHSIWAWRKRLSEQDRTEEVSAHGAHCTSNEAEENDLVDMTAMYEPTGEKVSGHVPRPALTIRTGAYHVDVYEDTPSSIIRNVLEVLRHV